MRRLIEREVEIMMRSLDIGKFPLCFCPFCFRLFAAAQSKNVPSFPPFPFTLVRHLQSKCIDGAGSHGMDNHWFAGSGRNLFAVPARAPSEAESGGGGTAAPSSGDAGKKQPNNKKAEDDDDGDSVNGAAGARQEQSCERTRAWFVFLLVIGTITPVAIGIAVINHFLDVEPISTSHHFVVKLAIGMVH